jgi:hypothetical protein
MYILCLNLERERVNLELEVLEAEFSMNTYRKC